MELMGREANDIGLILYKWSTQVDLNSIIDIPGISKILFETELIANHIHYKENGIVHEDLEDLSCHQYSYFITTILTRLVLQGHSKFGMKALHRIIELNSDPLVRDSVGSHLTQCSLQISGIEKWDLPKLPKLRDLFIEKGGLKCIALDSYDDCTFRRVCIDFLHSVTINEWKREYVKHRSNINIVMRYFVIPSLDSDLEDIRDIASDVFGSLFCIDGVRELFLGWAEREVSLSIFSRFVVTNYKKIIMEATKNNQDNISLKYPLFFKIGKKIAKMWIEEQSK